MNEFASSQDVTDESLRLGLVAKDLLNPKYLQAVTQAALQRAAAMQD
jgi:hypothetical protein